MAILFAKAMGCSVTAITSDHLKGTVDIYEMGADEVRRTDDMEDSHTGNLMIDGKIWDSSTRHSPRPMSIDVLLITSNVVPDLSDYFGLLARRATIVLMTIQQDPISIPYMPFVLPGHRLIASTEASLQNHFEMLAFAGEHKIKPWIEKFPMTLEGVAEAFEKLETGKMRYRGVLVREGTSDGFVEDFKQPKRQRC